MNAADKNPPGVLAGRLGIHDARSAEWVLWVFLGDVSSQRAPRHDAYPAPEAQALRPLRVLYRNHIPWVQICDHRDPFCRNLVRLEDLGVSVATDYVGDMSDLAQCGLVGHDVDLCHRCGSSCHALQNDCQLDLGLFRCHDTMILRQE